MNYEEYLSLVERRFEKTCNFNIIKDIEERDIKIDLFANSIFVSCNLFKNKITPFTKFEIYENYYLKHFDYISNKEVQEYFDFLRLIIDGELPTYQHLQKCVIGIMICDSIGENCKNLIGSLNDIKPFSMYFKGWNEIQLICVDLNIKKIYFNSAAQKNTEFFLF